jgi:uncharacterized membrane protein
VGFFPALPIQIGAFVFSLIAAFLAFTLARTRREVPTLSLILSGVVVSAFLVYLQIFVIRAICPWCMLSAFTMTALFILSIVVLCQMRSLDQSESAGQQRA